MRFVIPIAVVALLAVLLSIVCCLPSTTSLHSLYTEDDLVFEQALLGTWVILSEEDSFEQGTDLTDNTRFTDMDEEGYYRHSVEDEDEDVWRFGSVEENPVLYRLEHSGDGADAAFNAHLVKLGDSLFLDLFPIEFEAGDWLMETSLVEAHTTYRVEQIKPVLRLSGFDEDWLDAYMNNNPQAIAHERVGEYNRVVFTAPTEELQVAIPKLFAEEDVVLVTFQLARLSAMPTAQLPEPPNDPAAADESE